MIKTPIDIDESMLSSIVPSVDGVVDQLKMLFGMNDITSIMVDDKTAILNDKWNLGNFMKGAGYELEDSQLIISFESDDADNGVIRNPIRDNPNKPILYDPIARADVRPDYVRTKVDISITIAVKSRTKLFKVIDKIKRQYRTTTDLQLHTIRHQMEIPRPIIDLFYEISLTRNDALGLTEDFGTYLRSIADNRVTFTVAQDGVIRSDSLSVVETRVGIQGYFDGVYSSKDVSSSVDGYSKLDLNYTFTYDKPVGFDLAYNQMVYNMLLPDDYIMFGTRHNRQPKQLAYDQWLQEWFSTFAETNMILSLMSSNDKYIKIPYYDIHDDISTPSHMARLFTKMTSLDEDLRCLGNLNDLDDITLKPEILEFLRNGEYEFINRELYSIFYVQLIENDKPVNIKLTIDADLNVCSTVDLDITKSYRISFNYIIDIIHLTIAARERVLENPWLIDNTIAILKYITGDNSNDAAIVDSSIILNNNSNLVGMVAKYTHNIYESRYFVSSIITRLMNVKGE